MRSFLAIDFPEQTKRNIADLQKDLKQKCETGRWKYIDNFHLTLRFLDEISDTQVTNICTAAKKVSSEFAPFRLKLSNIGQFKGVGNNIRVLWLGIGDGINQLKNIKSCLDTVLEPIGFPIESRPFSPHITIGQDVLPKEGINLFNSIKFNEEIPVDKIVLMKSEQIAGKRIYTVVRSFPFAKEIT